MSPLLLQSATAFFVTLGCIVILAPLARRLGLVDTPTKRKRHSGDVPLVGGVAIFITLCIGGYVWGYSNQSTILVNGNDALWVFFAAGLLLVTIGSLDDQFGLGVFIRVITEIAVALIIIEGLDLRVSNLGNLISTGAITLTPTIAYPFTIIAVFGIINAFNMLDGIDGLLAGLVLVALITVHLLSGQTPGFISLFLGASLLAFLASNLGLSPFIPKTFLGDAGSKLLGFIVVCLILAATSQQVGGQKLVPPATALFIVGLPLFDMVFTTLRRGLNRVSPFSADRSHIHHLMLDLGFSHRRAVMIIITISAAISFLGIMLHRGGTSETTQMSVFGGCFLFYSVLVSQTWLVARRLQDARTVKNANSDL
jgi:UDP-GlcNAc:undecaprenyl-phosphate/decaprenyl-phosphate GlcNAc-1-phosphate transferase